MRCSLAPIRATEIPATRLEKVSSNNDDLKPRPSQRLESQRTCQIANDA